MTGSARQIVLVGLVLVAPALQAQQFAAADSLAPITSLGLPSPYRLYSGFGVGARDLDLHLPPREPVSPRPHGRRRRSSELRVAPAGVNFLPIGMAHGCSLLPKRPLASLPLALAASLGLGACTPVVNLTNVAAPRFEGSYAVAPPGSATAAPIRVVSFNIKFAREIDSALTVLESDSLRQADVVALQEMDDRGVERIARALGLNYTYYPASIHPASGKYFGPAVLSRWPIERSWKVLLPHQGWTRGQRRTATAAVIRVGGAPLLVYAVHLETPIQISDAERRDQVMTVAADAAKHQGPVVIAGDFNGETVGPVLRRLGYDWQTAGVGPTVAWFSYDHIFTRGLSRPEPISVGAVRELRGASDHRPVWAVVLVAGQGGGGAGGQ